MIRGGSFGRVHRVVIVVKLDPWQNKGDQRNNHVDYRQIDRVEVSAWIVTTAMKTATVVTRLVAMAMND